MTTTPPPEPDEQGRGPIVPDTETLLRVVPPKAARNWMPAGVPSSAMFHEPQFSADLERLADIDELAARWSGGNAIVAFNCGLAREHGFSTHHKPEPFPNSTATNEAHCDVYGVEGKNDRKKKARALAATCADSIRRHPDPPLAAAETNEAG